MKSRSFIMAINIAKQYQQQSQTSFSSYSLLNQKMMRGFNSASSKKRKVTPEDVGREATDFAEKLDSFVKQEVEIGVDTLEEKVNETIKTKFEDFEREVSKEAARQTKEFEKTLEIKLRRFDESKKEIDEQIKELQEAQTTLAQKVEATSGTIQKNNETNEQMKMQLEKHNQEWERLKWKVGSIGVVITGMSYFFTNVISSKINDKFREFTQEVKNTLLLPNNTEQKIAAIQQRQLAVDKAQREHDSYLPLPWRNVRRSQRKQIEKWREENQKLQACMNDRTCSVDKCLSGKDDDQHVVQMTMGNY